jgi:beta-lactam-binding protein with PASTA domain/tRNA A-37 threonylcarbamoyl transferase component Bud32
MTVLEPGGIIGERYELGRQLGAGGMARVYRAHDRLLDREVAVKVLSERYAADPAFVERFRREASAAAGLNHANIVSVYDRGETDGSYYIVMEYFDGPDLKQVIRQRGTLPPEEAVDAALQILAALAAAHRRDVIHRDIKPQNVMVGEDGRLKVTDFGIARAGADSAMTEAGAIIGTAQYLSPEQARGEEVTTASDCYAVGIVLYEMLTGQVPFDGDRAVSVAMKQINDRPVRPRALNPEIPASLDAVVMRALEKRPAERYRTAQEFGRALLDVRKELAGAEPTEVIGAATAQLTQPTQVMGAASAPPTRIQRRPPAPPDPPRRRRRGPLIAGAIVAALLAAGAAAYFLVGEGGPDQVAIPEVTGQTAAAAIRELQAAELEAARVNRANASFPAGDVVDTNPEEGVSVDKGSTVTLVVSTGPELISVPNVVGQPLDNARATLSQFTVQTAPEEFSSDVAAGNVISQEPSGGTAAPGSVVTLTVSKGPEQVTVRDVRNVSLSTATDILESQGLAVGTVTKQESSRSEGTVIAQDPGPTATVDKGSSVDLTIAETPDVQVPSVIGLTGDAAESKLSGLGFDVISQGQETTSAPADQVIDQQPAPNTTVSAGSRVVIIVAVAPTDTGGAQPPPPGGLGGGDEGGDG